MSKNINDLLGELDDFLGESPVAGNGADDEDPYDVLSGYADEPVASLPTPAKAPMPIAPPSISATVASPAKAFQAPVPKANVAPTSPAPSLTQQSPPQPRLARAMQMPMPPATYSAPTGLQSMNALRAPSNQQPMYMQQQQQTTSGVSMGRTLSMSSSINSADMYRRPSMASSPNNNMYDMPQQQQYIQRPGSQMQMAPQMYDQQQQQFQPQQIPFNQRPISQLSGFSNNNVPYESPEKQALRMELERTKQEVMDRIQMNQILMQQQEQLVLQQQQKEKEEAEAREQAEIRALREELERAKLELTERMQANQSLMAQNKEVAGVVGAAAAPESVVAAADAAAESSASSAPATLKDGDTASVKSASTTATKQSNSTSAWGGLFGRSKSVSAGTSEKKKPQTPSTTANDTASTTSGGEKKEVKKKKSSAAPPLYMQQGMAIGGMGIGRF